VRFTNWLVTSGEAFPVPPELEVGWAADLFGTCCRREKRCATVGNQNTNPQLSNF